jgi:methionine synthase I (cobalamin-dependent)
MRAARGGRGGKIAAGPGVFVAGAIGPTTKTSSISTDVNNPGARGTNYDELVTAYSEQIRGLLDGGADVLLVETIFDTLNARAAFFAIETVFDQRGIRPLPYGRRTVSGPSKNASRFWRASLSSRPAAIAASPARRSRRFGIPFRICRC